MIVTFAASAMAWITNAAAVTVTAAWVAVCGSVTAAWVTIAAAVVA
jgi:hypothetical protein